MTQLNHYDRGLRRALRDVQRTVDVYSRNMLAHGSVISAVISAGNSLTFELADLRKRRGSVLPAITPEREQHVVELDGVSHSARSKIEKTAYFAGYCRGFVKALEIIHTHGEQMCHPPARIGIRKLVHKLNREYWLMRHCGQCSTLRHRKFRI